MPAVGRALPYSGRYWDRTSDLFRVRVVGPELPSFFKTSGCLQSHEIHHRGDFWCDSFCASREGILECGCASSHAVLERRESYSRLAGITRSGEGLRCVEQQG